jgi:hypothetical protein
MSFGVKMGNGFLRVERDGWFIDIETLDVSARPNWEIRCRIRRTKEDYEEERGHRFFVSPELSERYQLTEMSEQQREKLMTQAAKRVILRELEAIFEEPAGGLDSLRPLTASDLG